jgi:hypothetical protein
MCVPPVVRWVQDDDGSYAAVDSVCTESPTFTAGYRVVSAALVGSKGGLTDAWQRKRLRAGMARNH